MADLDPRVPPPAQPWVTVRGADPSAWAALGDRAVFLAHTPAVGRELWITDGTPTGTRQLADLCPGRCDANVELLGAARGVLFFTGSSEIQPRTVWRTDGTRSGTFPLATVTSGTPLVTPSGLFFAGRSDGGGIEPWLSDGTAAGTRQLVDLVPGSVGSEPAWFTRVGDRVLFGTVGGGNASIWSTDGRAAGTVRLLTGFLRHAASVGNRAFFIADNAAGSQLWVTDGSPAGTRRISSLPPVLLTTASSLVPSGSGVLFTAEDAAHGRELYRGAAGGVWRVSETRLGPVTFAGAGERVVYTAWDDSSTFRLFASEGTRVGTPLAVGCSEPCPELSYGAPLSSLGDRVLFAGRNGSHGVELWSTDGTPAGTTRLTDACPGDCDAGLGEIVIAGRRAFFSAGRAYAYDVELWTTLGTPASTRRISDFVVDDAFAQIDQPRQLRGVWTGRRFFFGAADPAWGLQPWVTDGTRAGTRLVTVLEAAGAGSFPHPLSAMKDGVSFAACDGEMVRIFTSDGSSGGTRPLATPQADLTCGDGWSAGYPWGRANGDQVFFVDAGEVDPVLWRVADDGSGLTKLVELVGYQWPMSLVPWGTRGVASFVLDRSLGGLFLVTSDGSPTGTSVISLPEGFGHPRELHAVGERLFWTGYFPGGGDGLWTLEGGEVVWLAPAGHGFVTYKGATYFQGTGGLWRTDGTPGGTALVWAQPGPLGPTAILGDLVAHAGWLYFFGQGIGSAGLWRSDGTTSGTTLVTNLSNVALGPRHLTSTAAGLFFSGIDSTHGRELWTSDGTAAGTRRVLDIAPGPHSSTPEELTAAGEVVLFTAHGMSHGRELWTSDGTAAGTRMVLDIAPGFPSSDPDQLTVAAGRLFFTADDGLHGRELWSLPLAAPSGCTPTTTRLCLRGGRYAVEARWRDHGGASGVGTTVPLTGDTGAFWFFSPGNLELAVKVLDGSAVNAHRWVFYGALSDVEYTLTVTDAATGAVRRYLNPAGVQASVGDTSAFGPNGATGAPLVSRPQALSAPVRVAASPATGPCTPAPERLCLAGGRFAVTVAWQTSGGTGVGHALPLVSDTGAFWFFDAANVELLVKVLDGRPVNGAWWVFFGALSNVAYTVTVTDTLSGRVVEYRNPSGKFASVGDTSAFRD